MRLRVGLMAHASLGGSSRVAYEMALALHQQQHIVELFSLHPPVFNPQERAPVSVRVLHQEPPSSNPGVLSKHWPVDQLRAFTEMVIADLRRHPLDILHFHYAQPFADIAWAIKNALGPAAPVIVGTLHGTDLTDLRGRAGDARALSHKLSAADALTTVSRAHADNADELLLDTRRPMVIPNFIDFERFRSFAAPSSSRGPQRSLIHASNFRAVKQPLSMARIFLGLAQRHELELTLLGTGPLLEETQDFLQQAQARVKTLGFQSCVRDALSAADLLLVSSRYESFCMIALEAMACGTPVLAPRVGGLPEVVKDGVTGLLYTPGDVHEAIDKASELLSQPKRLASLGRQARVHSEGFSAEAILPRYLKLYRQLLDARSPARMGARSTNWES